MNYLANLQQMLDFYRKNGGTRANPMANVPLMGGGYAGDSGEAVPGLNWAQSAMQQSGNQQPQDFFGDEGGSRNALAEYVRPSQDGAGAMPQRPRGIPRRDNSIMRGGSMNYLAKLMGGR